MHPYFGVSNRKVEKVETITCPCCRAANDAGPACRRCKADLTLLFAVADRRGFLVSEARNLAADGKYGDALRSLDEAAALRAGDDVRQLGAAVRLLAGDYAAARAAYDGLTNPS
jgi:Flp pilus assembly protein TadD